MVSKVCLLTWKEEKNNKTKQKCPFVGVWKDLLGTFFREETLELINRIVLNLSVFLWGLFKVS